METLARGPQQEFRHVAAIHDSDEVLLAQVVPFVEAGLRAGDPIVVSLNPPVPGAAGLATRPSAATT